MSQNHAVNRIGVLTSGGDAPGMNAAIRSVVRTATCLEIECIGIRRGYSGLIHGDIIKLSQESVKGITGQGGTILYTARSAEFGTPEGKVKAAAFCNNMGIEGIVTIGGDGTFKGAMGLAELGINVVGVPCTIDNDIGCTTYTIGFDTACNTAVEAVDRLNDTMQSHERCSVVEVMGRHAGHLALGVGIATGATIILVPEVKYDFEVDVVERIRQARLAGRSNFTVIVAEGAEHGSSVAEKISKATGIDTRFTAIGHIQRGGSPHVRDRIAATAMGYKAVTLLAAGHKSRIVAMRGDKYIDLDVHEALSLTKDFDYELYKSFTALTFLDKNTLIQSFKST